MRIASLSAALAVLTLAPGWAQEPSSPEGTAAVDPAVIELLTAWGETHAGRTGFRARVIDTLDDVWDNGQKIQMSHIRTVTMERPNHLRIESQGDTGQRDFIFDGETVTVADHGQGVYAQVAFSGSIDEMMDMLIDDYGVSTPLADILSESPADVLLDGLEEATVVGTGLVGDVECTQIACRQEEIDWQAWFSEGDAPALRRLVITYRNLPAQPQYSMQVLELEAAPAPEGAFDLATGDLTEIPFRPLSASPEAEMTDAL